MCLVLNEAEAALGTVNAKALITMIADIEAQENGEEVLDFMNDIAQTGGGDTLEISFGRDCHAIFVPVGTRFQRGPEERVIWSTVQRLKLLAIEGCDGS
jgi:hypothetical protein